MVSEKVTIDNLRIKDHNKYANNQKAFNPVFVKDSPFISQQSTIDSIEPFYHSAFDKLFGLIFKNQPWARFEAPPFSLNRFHCFSSSIVPFLDSENHLSQKIDQAYLDSVHMFYAKEEIPSKFSQENLTQTKHDLIQSLENTISTEFLMQQQEILKELITCVEDLNKMIVECNTRRLQYQKG
ncbi:MAG: DUF5399 family protein [Rhabdochlamydiaceae bacterium]